MPRLPSASALALGLSGACGVNIGGSLNWEDGRSTWKVFSGLRRMSEDSGAGTQPGSCGPQEGIPGASLDSSGSGRSPGAGRGTADLRAALAMGQLMSTWAPTRLWRLLYEPGAWSIVRSKGSRGKRGHT
eukprot:scaffold1861_cov111-Isochrysis_galbana.AAC.2